MSSVVYQASRMAMLDGWWVWAAVIIAIALIFAVSIFFYRRDVAELLPAIRRALVWMRIVSIAGLVFFFFDVTRRTQREMTRPSEVAVLVDTSQSMSLPMDTGRDSRPRIERTQTLMASGGLVDQLAGKHRTSVYQLGDAGTADLIAVRETSNNDEPEIAPEQLGVDRGGMVAAWVGLVLVSAGVIIGLLSLLLAATKSAVAAGRAVLATAILLPIGIITLGATFAIHPQRTLAELIVGMPPSNDIPDQPVGDKTTAEAVTDWEQALTASRTQSRIGDGIRSTLASHDSSTLAGVVVITDGQNNGGIATTTAAALAGRNEVAVVPIGMGSNAMPTNVRIVDLDAPRRVYPGDRFIVTTVLQASGSSALPVDVQLLDELDSSDDSATSTKSLPTELLETKRVTLAADSTLQTLRFEVDPQQVGRRRLAVRIVAPAADQNQDDDSRDARYEVVARKLRVLAVAGGPTREYQFVRNLLFRDPSVELDVWLQTGREGMSQDADRLLPTMPSTAAELFEYDAVIMFDPDWTAFDLATMELLDRYLAAQAGGLVLIAGPVYHPEWIRRRTDPLVPLIANLFPVTFSTGSPIASGGRTGGDQSWPLELTDEAARADFMDIANNVDDSAEAWRDFGGVYDYVSVRDAKPAAKVYAYFSDPTTKLGGALPIFMASQFYGAGRVAFLASGEMWRLRGEDESYFDSFYTKLVRWVSQGRLLRDSKRGVLLVDNTRAMVGDTITLRAVLVNDQFEPLVAPEVIAKVLSPNGSIETLTLLPEEGGGRAGTFGGRYVTRQSGDYEFRVTVGQGLDEETLRQSVAVRLPTIELERPQRNDPDLVSIASTTGGVYIPVNIDVTDNAIVRMVMSKIIAQPQNTTLPGTADNDFARRRNATLLWLVATMLTMEWIVRRLNRLA